ncbi:hypothetical protein [Pseudogemmobacter bohemicus]|uniref:hypothetical protein n=1 Tax=Pseudogemmobacter bohemicus TaxID=2250708 RepID=UPI0018E55C0D|nr:hypothetical protein [Pseudogemmobacter bohemicus]
MWINPLPTPIAASGEGSHGSVLTGNYAPARLSSAWKSTKVDVIEELRISVAVGQNWAA